MKREWIRLWSVSWLVLFQVGCTPSHFGTYPGGLAKFPDRPFSASQAVERAQPYLEETFSLRRKARDETGERGSKPKVFVTLKGRHYYIIKDDYPYIFQSSYQSHAVKVDSKTGEVIPPK
jgi:hypothetical protein